jgi:hypothetical protein
VGKEWDGRLARLFLLFFDGRDARQTVGHTGETIPLSAKSIRRTSLDFPRRTRKSDAGLGKTGAVGNPNNLLAGRSV